MILKVNLKYSKADKNVHYKKKSQLRKKYT